jgi:hypothetical protein
VSLAAKAAAVAKSPRTAVGAVLLALAAASAITTWTRPDVKQAIGDVASRGVAGFNSVAALIAARSPGERPAGELASLKSKRQAAPHERALAKVRRAAPGTLASIVAPSAAPPVIVPPIAAAPLFNAVAPPPVIAAATPISGAPPGGFPAITPLPGGGGGVIVPPVVIPSSPVIPVTPAAPLPEPSAWAMMLIGLVMIGRLVERSRATATNE